MWVSPETRLMFIRAASRHSGMTVSRLEDPLDVNFPHALSSNSKRIAGRLIFVVSVLVGHELSY